MATEQLLRGWRRDRVKITRRVAKEVGTRKERPRLLADQARRAARALELSAGAPENADRGNELSLVGLGPASTSEQQDPNGGSLVTPKNGQMLAACLV